LFKLLKSEDSSSQLNKKIDAPILEQIPVHNKPPLKQLEEKSDKIP